MSDSRPIGIFDSGIGGLTVAKEILSLLPHESTIYIGDTARVPYGNRSPQTVIDFSQQIAQKLVDHQVKAIVVACATASSVALQALQHHFPQIPILGVIQASAKDAALATHTQHIGIIGTRATINSQSFETALHRLDSHLVLHPQSCPLFVPLIEEGITHQQSILSPVIDYYLSDFKSTPIDTLILGCTHYPIIATTIKAYLPNVQLINTGISVAKELQSLLVSFQIATDSSHNPTHSYYVTDLNPNFARTATVFMNHLIQVEKIEL